MRFHVLTLFPEMVENGLNTSITGRAIKNGKIKINAVNIRDYTLDKHGKVDDYIYGGGAGMLMQAEPVYRAYEAALAKIPDNPKKVRCVYVTPQGQTFNQTMAEDFAKEDDLMILCGHYEGIDERVLEEVVTDYVSIGDYVLTGGELAAMVMIDAISRLVPGVLHNDESSVKESFSGNLLEYPQYSRPEVWHGKAVPPELLSGNPKIINSYRRSEQIKRTSLRRPDLFKEYERLEKAKELMLKKDKFLHMDMIEHINRETGKLLYMDDKDIVLLDKICGTVFHTSLCNDAEVAVSSEVLKILKNAKTIAFHQEELSHKYGEILGLNIYFRAYNGVLTRKEKLPIKNKELYMRPLMPGDERIVLERYDSLSGPQYIERLINKGMLYGAFLKENDKDVITAFGGFHEDGSVGLMYVFEEYRRKHICETFLSFLFNLELEKGHIPYCEYVEGNEAIRGVLNKLGLYSSKTKVFWAEEKI